MTNLPIFLEIPGKSPSSRSAALITALTTIPNTEVADLIVPRAAKKESTKKIDCKIIKENIKNKIVVRNKKLYPNRNPDR
jgi:hypothetical protein